MSKMSKKIKDFYKENKKSTLIVYVTLRILVIVCMIGEILRKNWDNVFLCVLQEFNLTPLFLFLFHFY